MSLEKAIEAALGVRPMAVHRLSGGSIGDVYRVALADDTIVAKFDDRPNARLDIEAAMLTYLAENSQLPVPAVLSASPNLLLMTCEPGRSQFSESAQRHAARLLASLHTVTAPQFGLEIDTLIGGLHQPNLWTASWVDFFREQRLLNFGREAATERMLPSPVLHRLEQFAAHLDRWLIEPEQPALIHGDVWTTNVLANAECVTAFLDPAIYYADPEIELAFTTLFHTFGRPFYEQYAAIRPIRDGFFEERCDIYNLYPLLVHVRLFGGGYVDAVSRTLQRFGF
ncbi:MAG: fructosamine kinase family protein [Anaerolineae bacterium]|nr:fructosamine kinase family protein [Anaerolineae bacterium]MCO5206984.1 fructosamine kinase family protein [Anaerolineae bacterium]